MYPGLFTAKINITSDSNWRTSVFVGLSELGLNVTDYQGPIGLNNWSVYSFAFFPDPMVLTFSNRDVLSGTPEYLISDKDC